MACEVDKKQVKKRQDTSSVYTISHNTTDYGASIKCLECMCIYVCTVDEADVTFQVNQLCSMGTMCATGFMWVVFWGPEAISD